MSEETEEESGLTVTALTLAPVDPEWVKEAVAAYIKA